MATVLKFGEPPATPGGDFEKTCVQALASKLPDDYTLITNLALPTHQSNFYEYDIVVASAVGYDVVECKLMHSIVRVGEDFIGGTGDYFKNNVFSTLANKCRVLESRLVKPPFSGTDGYHPTFRIIVPDQCDVDFLYKPHKENEKVLRLGDYVRGLRQRSPLAPSARNTLRDRWTTYRTKYQAPTERRDGRLGRFSIKRRLEARGDQVAYLAVDEPPCKADVHLLEVPFPDGLTAAELEAYIAEAARAMVALRRLRHPLIQCVTGHFYTGSSLVQVSDWFDGESLERLIGVAQLSLDDKILLMSRITEALIYCHQQSVFHRNIHPANVLVAGNCHDIQLTGFECVKDVRQTGTAMAVELGKRDRRLIPPEDLHRGNSINYRLYDIFQAGVLFYWILEDGRWPFDSTYDYVTGNGQLEFARQLDPRFDRLTGLISSMLAIQSDRRPDLFQRVLAKLQSLE